MRTFPLRQGSQTLDRIWERRLRESPVRYIERCQKLELPLELNRDIEKDEGVDCASKIIVKL